MTVKKSEVIEAMARAMAVRNGTRIDDMRPSTGNKWRYIAEAAYDAFQAIAMREGGDAA